MPGAPSPDQPQPAIQTPDRFKPVHNLIEKVKHSLGKKEGKMIEGSEEALAEGQGEKGLKEIKEIAEEVQHAETAQPVPLTELGPKFEENQPEALQPIEPIESVTAEGQGITSEDQHAKPKAILDPETEYQKAVAEVQSQDTKDVFSILTKHVNQEIPSVKNTAEKPRVFNTQDKVRHTLLTLEARRQGVKDIQGFNRLVEYFETTLNKTNSYHETYKADISDNERVKIVAAWRAKGFEDIYFDYEPKNGKLKLNMNKYMPYNAKRDNVAVIKAFLETGVDPIPLLGALRPTIKFRTSLLASNMMDSSYPSETTKFIELLQDPNLENMFPLIKGMVSVPHAEWELRTYRDEKTEVDKLRELVKGADISAYSTEFFEKAGLMAKVLGRNVSIEELPTYNEIIHNQDKLTFLAAAMEKGALPRAEEGLSIFDSLNALERDNLLNPLTTLINSGVKIDRLIFGGLRPRYDQPVLTQDEVSQNLLKFIGEPAVQVVLNDQDMQRFAQVLQKMNGSSVSPDLVGELYPIRQDLIAINNLIFPSLDAKYGESYSNDRKLEELKSLAQNEERRKVLLDPDFQEYLRGLKDKGITLQPRDFFRYEKDIFDHSEYSKGRYEALLIQLFKARDITDIIDLDIQKRIINPPGGSYNIYDDLFRLEKFTFFEHTIRLLKQYDIPLAPENFKDDNWIATVSHMLLMESSFLNVIPQDKKAVWINASIKLPRNLQESISGYIEYDENRMPIITNEDIERVRKLGDIISSSDFFPKEHFQQYDSKMQEIYTILGEYKGDVDSIFTNGRPNVEFAKLLIDQKKPSGLSLVLKADMLESFDVDSRNALGVWIELPYQLQIRSAADEIAFPALRPEVADRYKVTADLMGFANTEHLSDNLINFVRRTENYQELLLDGKQSRIFLDAVIKQKNFEMLSQFLTEEVLLQYSGEERSIFETCKELPSSLQERLLGESAFPDLDFTIADRYKVAADLMRFASIDSMDNNLINFVRNADNYQDLLIDERPSKVFIDAVIKNKDFQTLPKFLTEDVLSQYDSAEKSVFATWMTLPDDLKQEVIKEAPDFPNIPVDQAEKYRVAAETITRIRNSPSVEIKRLERELIGQLWKLDNPTQALEEIISVFEKNNLPLVGKVYRVFETIYDNPNATGTTTLEQDLSNKTNLSPVLKVATPRERREIIYKDLLSINVASGNPQLRDYLEVLRDGEQVVSKMEQEGVGALSDREQNQLGHFFDKMDMLYSTSLFGRTIENRRRAKHIDSSPSTSYLRLEERRDALRKNFRVRSDQKFTDRLSEMFLRPVGFTKIEDVLEKMDSSKARADLRNREFVRANDGKIVLKPGDRFKGVSSADIGKILERGAVAREYLGVSAGSDATPYDTDTGLILEQDLANGVTSAIGASPSNGYGDILLVVKDRKQFGTGDNQYESFASGVVGERHYGIRTGFASTEIDAIIANNSSFDARKLDDLFMAIAQQGVYIPVGDANGEIVFTPERFDEYRKTFDGVSEYSSSPVTVKRVGVDEATYAFPNSPQVVASTKGVLDQLMEEVIIDRGKVIDLSSEIRKRISDALAGNGVTLRGEFDTSIYGAEFVDTGSTARGSNVPGDYDFDMSLQLDPNDSKRLDEIANVVKSALKLQQDASHTETDYVQVRGMGSQIIEGQTLDIDIGIGKRSDEGIFASSDAVAQKLDSIRTTFGDETYHDVLTNIVLAKKILKEGHAYKKLEDGGLGGIGVENWILLHNGNILDAFESFWQAAHDESGNAVPYEEFANMYKIFDAGYNIKFNRHDNFAHVLKSNGYTAMVNTIGQYLGY